MIVPKYFITLELFFLYSLAIKLVVVIWLVIVIKLFVVIDLVIILLIHFVFVNTMNDMSF